MSTSNNHSMTSAPRLAAICTEFGAEADVIIDQVVTRLLAEGKNIVGMRQIAMAGHTSRCAAQLQSIESGKYHRITQALGNESVSCSIDVEALEQVARRLAESLSSNLDLVVINRFGKRESAGGGFCCVIQRALELDVPVLTVVNSQWQQRWHDYGAGYVTTLPNSSLCVLEWCHCSIKHSAQIDTPIVNTQKAEISKA